jgi:hypothetical protein
MDLDFHFSTVYVLSHWADFGSNSSRIIATSSQLVDDNFDSTPFSDEEEEKILLKAYKSDIPAKMSEVI